jgi:hypothetical protein
MPPIPDRPVRPSNRLWRLWAKALGEKVGSTDAEADAIAWVRTAIVAFSILTNLVIIAGILRHW